MNAQEAMNPTIEEAIRRLEGMVFTCDLSPETLREIAVNKMCLAALRAEEEREKGCEYCLEFEDLPEHFENGVAVGKVFDTCIQPDEKGRWHIELPQGADIGIRFCPMCGKRLEVEP